MTENIIKYPYGKRKKYPGLMKKDITVWESYIDKHPTLPVQCAYNVRIGEGVKLSQEMPGKLTTMATAITQLRIDVVMFEQNRTWIIELKPIASCTALGQLLAYQHLFIKKYHPVAIVQPSVLCYYCNPDLLKVFQHLHFHVETVSAPDGFHS